MKTKPAEMTTTIGEHLKNKVTDQPNARPSKPPGTTNGETLSSLKAEIKRRKRWDEKFAKRVVKKWQACRAKGMTYATFNEKLGLDEQRVRAWETRFNDKRTSGKTKKKPARNTSISQVLKPFRDAPTAAPTPVVEHPSNVRARLETIARELKDIGKDNPTLTPHTTEAARHLVEGIKATLDVEFDTTKHNPIRDLSLSEHLDVSDPVSRQRRTG